MLDRDYFDSLSNLGPFEIKDELIRLARTGAERSAKAFLNAGRGNPNWIATRAREAFESVMGHLPRNTIGVYSYSKYFGCTGRRLGVVAVAQDNIFDERIRAHPEEVQQLLDQRYKTLTPKPREVRFIDRIVADSRDVALNRTAGLSLPQQVMMILFGLVEMMDEDKTYQKACIAICEKRFRSLVEGMGVESNPGPTSTTTTASSIWNSGSGSIWETTWSPGSRRTFTRSTSRSGWRRTTASCC